MSFLAFSWAAMVSRRYPACWDSIKTHSGAEIDFNAGNSLEGRVTGLILPRPPRRAGKPINYAPDHSQELCRSKQELAGT